MPAQSSSANPAKVTKPVVRAAAVTEPEQSLEVSVEMKVEFCNKIKKLTPETLTKFVGYV